MALGCEHERAIAVLRPTSLVEAARMASLPNSSIVAGGCEFGLSSRHGAARPDRLIVLQAISGLETLKAHPKIGLSIGALVRMDAIANNLWVAKRWAALHEAVEQLMPPQVRNMATVVGNLCAGRADYDMAPALFALGAVVHVVLSNGVTTSLPVAEFHSEDGRSKLGPGAIVREIFLPPPSPDAGSAFRKIRFGETSLNAAAYVALNSEEIGSLGRPWCWAVRYQPPFSLRTLMRNCREQRQRP